MLFDKVIDGFEKTDCEYAANEAINKTIYNIFLILSKSV